MRRLKTEDLIGKTIVGVNCDAINMMAITFDDETEVSIWCEPSVSTAVGNIWGFFVEDDDSDNT